MQIVLGSVLFTFIVPQCLVLSRVLTYGPWNLKEWMRKWQKRWVSKTNEVPKILAGEKKMQFYIPVRPGSNIRCACEFWWRVVGLLFGGRKGFLRPASYKAWKKKPQKHSHRLNESVQLLAPVCKLTHCSPGCLCAHSSLYREDLMKSVRQISNDRKYKPPHTPAVWQEAWLPGDALQTCTDRLARPVLSPCHPASPSKIRLDVTNPSVQVLLGCRKCPWLNTNKGLCVRHMSPSKKCMFHQACAPPA